MPFLPWHKWISSMIWWLYEGWPMKLVLHKPMVADFNAEKKYCLMASYQLFWRTGQEKIEHRQHHHAIAWNVCQLWLNVQIWHMKDKLGVRIYNVWKCGLYESQGPPVLSQLHTCDFYLWQYTYPSPLQSLLFVAVQWPNPNPVTFISVSLLTHPPSTHLCLCLSILTEPPSSISILTQFHSSPTKHTKPSALPFCICNTYCKLLNNCMQIV